MDKLNEKFAKYASDIYIYVILLRVAFYGYVLHAAQALFTAGGWYVVGAVVMLLLGVVACAIIRPGLVVTTATILASATGATLTHLCVVGVDTVSASVFVLCAMFADAILVSIFTLIGISAPVKSMT